MRLALLILVLAAGGAKAESRFDREMVDAHNRVRAQVGVPPLVWSDHLEEIAEDWAKTLLSRRDFSHRPNAKLGENLFAITGARSSSAEVIRVWANESRDYDYRSNRCHNVCGHYTQIVWRDTQKVGCAVARDNRREIWVCNYDPPGNWVGHRPY
jgi:uncharacterized protein YkwD